MNFNNITLFLMTKKGFDTLNGINSKYLCLIKVVVVGCDRKILNDYEKEIIDFCIKNNIPYIKKNDFKVIETDYALAISWRWIINHNEDKLIILHDSLLPKYRGYAPLINSLISGEKKIGVTALFGAKKYDRGSVIYQSEFSIIYPIKIIDAIALISEGYINLVNKILEILFLDQKLISYKQIEENATYSLWLNEDDYLIDWGKTSTEIRRFIDSTGYPYRGAASFLGNKMIRILDAEEFLDVNIENRHPGKIIFFELNSPVVVCGSGLLKINEACLEMPNGSLEKYKISNVRSKFTNLQIK